MTKTEAVYQLHDKEARWFAVHAMPRHERKVVERLTAKGIEAYVPVSVKFKQYAKKRKKHHYVLLTGFVFVKIIKSELTRVLETESLYGLLKIGRDILAIPDEQIKMLRKIVGDEAMDVSLHNGEYHAGQEVEIVGGSLTGTKGILKRIEGKNRFIVKLEVVGVFLEMTVDPKAVQPVKPY